MIYTGIIDLALGKQAVYVASVPFEDITWENNHFLVPIPKNSIGVNNLVFNVLTAGTFDVPCLMVTLEV